MTWGELLGMKLMNPFGRRNLTEQAERFREEIAEKKRGPFCEVCGDRILFPVGNVDLTQTMCTLCRRWDWAAARMATILDGIVSRMGK